MDAVIASAYEILNSYKQLAERALAQVSDEQLHWRMDHDANSIAILMQHLAGNMQSRWTDFLTSDGEKPWRQRDEEFVDANASRAALMKQWEAGWQTLFSALEPLRHDHLMKTVKIRGVKHTVLQAVHRQVAHYSYHVGQIVTIARQVTGSGWKCLSIPRGQSLDYRPEPGSLR